MSKQKEFKTGDYVLFTPESNKERCEIRIVQGVVKNDIHVMLNDGTWAVEKSLLKLFEIGAGDWVRGKPKKDGWYNCSIVGAYDVFRFCVAKEVSQCFTKHSNINARLVEPDFYANNHSLIAYRRQSLRYAAWLRARNLPVGEVHGE